MLNRNLFRFQVFNEIYKIASSENLQQKEQMSGINTLLLWEIKISTPVVVLKVHTGTTVLIPHNRKLPEKIAKKRTYGKTMVITKKRGYQKNSGNLPVTT